MADVAIKKTGMRRWVKVLLFVSLALNLAVAGAVIGAMVKHRGDHGDWPHGIDRATVPYIHALPQRDKRALGKALREHGRDIPNARKNYRQDFQAALSILRTQPFDAVALQEVLTRQGAGPQARRLQGETLFLERISNMSDAERAAYADRLEDTLSERWRRAKERRH